MIRAHALVRHPILTGFVVAFWVAPHMTSGRLLFAVVPTAYLLVAVRFEERDLRAGLGQAYARYARRTRRFVPTLRRRNRRAADAA